MSLAAAFNQLGQTVMPAVATAVFPDTLTVQGSTEVTDSGGGYYTSAITTPYTDVPCVYEPINGQKFDSAGKLLSTELYRLTMPTHYSNAGTATRIDLASSYRLIVAARGNEPVKTFRIISIAEEQGVVYEIDCQREANETEAEGVNVYRALLSQSGTSAPVATVLENTLGGTVVWTRVSPGIYLGTLAGAFPAAKTFIPHPGISSDATIGQTVCGRSTDNAVAVLTSVEGGSADDELLNTSIEILVYP